MYRELDISIWYQWYRYHYDSYTSAVDERDQNIDADMRLFIAK